MTAARCANPLCACVLRVDHVTLVTTCHVRRFCSVDCITESHREYLATLGPSRKDASGQIDERGRASAPDGDRDDGRTRPVSPLRDAAIRGAGLRTASSLVKKDVKPIPKTGAKKKTVRK